MDTRKYSVLSLTIGAVYLIWISIWDVIFFNIMGVDKNEFLQHGSHIGFFMLMIGPPLAYYLPPFIESSLKGEIRMERWRAVGITCALLGWLPVLSPLGSKKLIFLFGTRQYLHAILYICALVLIIFTKGWLWKDWYFICSKNIKIKKVTK